MKRTSLMAVAFASMLLGGCATYDYVGNTAPGGYYSGRPSVEYYSPYGYDGYYGGSVGVYGGYGGYGGPYRYRGNYGYPYYGYYGSNYPYYRPHHHNPRPPRPGDGNHNPRPPSGGDRPPPWRDPTSGRWRESGSQPMVPQRSGGRAISTPSQPRMQDNGPRVNQAPPMPRNVDRPRAMERPAAPRAERPSQPAVRSQPRGERGSTRQLER